MSPSRLMRVLQDCQMTLFVWITRSRVEVGLAAT